MSKKSYAKILLLIAVILWLGGFIYMDYRATRTNSGSESKLEISRSLGMPNYVIIKVTSDAHTAADFDVQKLLQVKVNYKNLLIMSSVFALLLFVSGFLWGNSTFNPPSNTGTETNAQGGAAEI